MSVQSEDLLGSVLTQDSLQNALSNDTMIVQNSAQNEENEYKIRHIITRYN
jgi:hypothetical protein